MLTAEQKCLYEENGFVVIEPVFDDSELNALRRAADDLLEGEQIVRKIEPIIDVVSALEDLVTDERMTGPTEDLFGQEVVLFEDKLNYKSPVIGSAYPLHQDYAYWQAHTDRLITVSLLLDDATAENGCLRSVSGSHTSGLLPREDDHPRIITFDVDPTLAVDAPGQAGGLVIFSCYTAYHSYLNRTSDGRRGILYTYNPVSDGDTYPHHKGAQGRACREWLATCKQTR
ncbi:TPA: hypothetical protein DCE37_02285 [Candidatus Latescibacteria bacterium]|nr:hypothetical protein [Candidatus Latescibacterota bacterium]|tara:strand:- start:988 stop:1674 length:687 start_codon:yes stop_codon:yes gene_type:complete